MKLLLHIFCVVLITGIVTAQNSAPLYAATKEQQVEIQEINRSYQIEAAAISTNSSLSANARLVKLKQVLERRNTQMAQVLTLEQEAQIRKAQVKAQLKGISSTTQLNLAVNKAAIPVFSGKNVELLAGLNLTPVQTYKLDALFQVFYGENRSNTLSALTSSEQTERSTQLRKKQAAFNIEIAKILTQEQVARLQTNQVAQLHNN